MVRRLFIVHCAAAMLLAGCGRTPEETVSAPQEPERREFQVNGVVVEVLPEEKRVRIRHEEIPGYMRAMTMPFDVQDTNELTGVEAGHPVSFRMIVTDTDGWIDSIRITGPKTNMPPTTGPFRLVRDVEPLTVGDPLPEYHFTNQFGQAFSTTQFKGKALAIQFLFTRCPFPDFCPLMARNFAETRRKLLNLQNAPTNWHLLTISFDPEFDTPAVLKAYAEKNNYDPTHWTFATGSLIDVTAIGEQFGLTFWREPGSIISHNLRTVVVDPSGRVQAILPDNKWTPDELVTEMVKAAK